MSKEIKIIGKYGDKGWEETGRLNVGAIARGMDAENMADLLSDYCNSNMKDYRDGVCVGRKLQTHHRTLQASAIRLCLGIIIGLSTNDDNSPVYTDARNETPIAMGQEISELLKNGKLYMGYMI
jgi:hypothetical protein